MAEIDQLWEHVQDLPASGTASRALIDRLEDLTERIDELAAQAWPVNERGRQ